jgi:pimeloyl-ACP methyl ester carboxylesterase
MVVPRSRDVVVGDGRTVGVYDYGERDGSPVLVFHGTPASGAGFAWADAPARERGQHLIAPDRPGVGRSTPSDWTIADYPDQMAALADALGIERFAVWGYSGGGPYAVACAARLGDRVTATAVAAGMGQVGVWTTIDEFEKTDRQLLALSTKHPRVARIVMSTTARLARMSPKSAVKSFAKQLGPGDLQLMAMLGSPRETMALFTEAFGPHGARGVVADYVAVGQPWGVDLDAIRTPITIFHGEADTMVPLRHGEELARRLPSATFRVWPDVGHLGPVAHVGEILDSLR